MALSAGHADDDRGSARKPQRQIGQYFAARSGGHERPDRPVQDVMPVRAALKTNKNILEAGKRSRMQSACDLPHLCCRRIDQRIVRSGDRSLCTPHRPRQTGLRPD